MAETAVLGGSAGFVAPDLSPDPLMDTQAESSAAMDVTTATRGIEFIGNS
jgi:hypothetical protein